MAIQDTDILLVAVGGTNYKVTADNLAIYVNSKTATPGYVTNILDSDFFLIADGAVNYKVNANDLAEYVNAHPSAPSGGGGLLGGEPMDGGFFAGEINHPSEGQQTLIYMPKAGFLESGSGIYWGNETVGQTWATNSAFDGRANTLALADGTHGIFDYCISDPSGPNKGNFSLGGNGGGTGLGGYNDWYVPSLEEIRIVCQTIKASTYPNSESSDWEDGSGNQSRSYSTYSVVDPGKTVDARNPPICQGNEDMRNYTWLNGPGAAGDGWKTHWRDGLPVGLYVATSTVNPNDNEKYYNFDVDRYVAKGNTLISETDFFLMTVFIRRQPS